MFYWRDISLSKYMRLINYYYNGRITILFVNSFDSGILVWLSQYDNVMKYLNSLDYDILRWILNSCNVVMEHKNHAYR